MIDLKVVVNEIYAAAAIGDFEALEKHLTEDFQVKMPSTLPFGGLYTGKAVLRELFPIVMGAMGVTGMDRREMMVGPSSASNLVTMTFADPDTAAVEMLEVFYFKGDKVCEIRPFYYDSSLALAACEAFKRSQSS